MFYSNYRLQVYRVELHSTTTNLTPVQQTVHTSPHPYTESAKEKWNKWKRLGKICKQMC